MRSYIFSSSETPPKHPWATLWAWSLILGALILLGLEPLARAQGHTPHIDDSASFWSHHRVRASKRPGQVTLVGTSRTLLGIDTALLQSQLTGHPEVHQLSVSAGSALPVLEHLAHDPEFSGTLLLEFHPIHFAGNAPAPDSFSQSLVDQSENAPFYAPLETAMTTFFQQHLVILNGELQPKSLVRALLKGKPFPEPNAFALDSRRNQHTRRLLAALPMTPEDRVCAKVPPEEVRAHQETMASKLKRTQQAVALLQARGTRVLGFRANSTGRHRFKEQCHQARDQVYDRYAQAIPITWIHFEDVPELADLKSVDGSHLMGEESRIVTMYLARQLQALREP